MNRNRQGTRTPYICIVPNFSKIIVAQCQVTPESFAHTYYLQGSSIQWQIFLPEVFAASIEMHRSIAQKPSGTINSHIYIINQKDGPHFNGALDAVNQIFSDCKVIKMVASLSTIILCFKSKRIATLHDSFGFNGNQYMKSPKIKKVKRQGNIDSKMLKLQAIFPLKTTAYYASKIIK